MGLPCLERGRLYKKKKKKKQKNIYELLNKIELDFKILKLDFAHVLIPQGNALLLFSRYELLPLARQQPLTSKLDTEILARTVTLKLIEHDSLTANWLTPSTTTKTQSLPTSVTAAATPRRPHTCPPGSQPSSSHQVFFFFFFVKAPSFEAREAHRY